MGIPAQSLRLVATGNLPSGEVFNTGVWTMCATPIDNYDQLVLTMAPSQLAFNQLFTDLAGQMSAGVVPTTLHGYYYDGGEFANQATLSAELPLSATGGSAPIRTPDQVAVVASLRTGRAGRSFRGRMYLPLNGLDIGTNSQMSAGQADAAALAVKTCIDAINDVELTCVVMSATQTLATPITEVRVNTVMDTQRRRTNKIIPTHDAVQVIA